MIKYNHQKRTLLCSELLNWNCKDCNRSLCRLDDYSIKDEDIELLEEVI